MTIEEFSGKLKLMEEQYPGDASEALDAGARAMIRVLKRETPKSTKEHKNKLAKSWKKEIVDSWGKEPEAQISNKAPHYHLVERGVQNPKDYHGNPKPEWKDHLNKNIGFLEKAVSKNWDDVSKRMEKTFYGKVRDHLG